MQLYVPLIGELNHDDIVNILDAIQAASAFGSYLGHPKWNEQADLNRNSKVNILDVIILANNFGKHTPDKHALMFGGEAWQRDH